MVGILLPGMKLTAKENYVKSKGSIEGMVHFYAQDIKYLETEINQLLEECEEDKWIKEKYVCMF